MSSDILTQSGVRSVFPAILLASIAFYWQLFKIIGDGLQSILSGGIPVFGRTLGDMQLHLDPCVRTVPSMLLTWDEARKKNSDREYFVKQHSCIESATKALKAAIGEPLRGIEDGDVTVTNASLHQTVSYMDTRYPALTSQDITHISTLMTTKIHSIRELPTAVYNLNLYNKMLTKSGNPKSKFDLYCMLFEAVKEFPNGLAGANNFAISHPDPTDRTVDNLSNAIETYIASGSTNVLAENSHLNAAIQKLNPTIDELVARIAKLEVEKAALVSSRQASTKAKNSTHAGASPPKYCWFHGLGHSGTNCKQMARPGYTDAHRTCTGPASLPDPNNSNTNCIGHAAIVAPSGERNSSYPRYPPRTY